MKVTIFWSMTSYRLVMCYRRFRRACCLFRHSSVQLPLSPVVPNLCSRSSTIEWPIIAPRPYIFVINRRRKGALIRNNVQQHDLSAINKIDFNITAELWDVEVFLDWLESDFGWLVTSQSRQGLQPWHSQRLCSVFTQLLPFVGDHPHQGAP